MRVASRRTHGPGPGRSAHERRTRRRAPDRRLARRGGGADARTGPRPRGGRSDSSTERSSGASAPPWRDPMMTQHRCASQRPPLIGVVVDRRRVVPARQARRADVGAPLRQLTVRATSSAPASIADRVAAIGRSAGRGFPTARCSEDATSRDPFAPRRALRARAMTSAPQPGCQRIGATTRIRRHAHRTRMAGPAVDVRASGSMPTRTRRRRGQPWASQGSWLRAILLTDGGHADRRWARSTIRHACRDPLRGDRSRRVTLRYSGSRLRSDGYRLHHLVHPDRLTPGPRPSMALWTSMRMAPRR